MNILKATMALVLLSACMPPLPPDGAELFQANCASCHGVDARGGAMAGAPDLTTLAARHGGVFPAGYVMSTIDGYSRTETHGVMPIFGKMLEGKMEIWVDPDGVETPTPAALLRLEEYLEGLQG